MFYLMTHSTHFILRLYGIRHMVKDHSDSEKGNPLPPHRLLFPINSKGSFICTIPDKIAHTTAFVTPVVEHWLEQEIAQWVHPMKDRSNNLLHHERTLLPWSYISLPVSVKTSDLLSVLLICLVLNMNKIILLKNMYIVLSWLIKPCLFDA